MSKPRIVVGMSGGVDSSVAALLLKEQGYEVIGLFMKNWEDDDDDEYCSSRQDLIDAVSVADRIGIDIEAVNFSKEYKDRVFSEFLREYKSGRTPNPDVMCNAEIKFRAFLDHAMAMGAERIATGHYAQVREVDGLSQLLKAEDGTKDQSYFLYRLNQSQLSKTLFPLGGLYKREVREIARKAGLANFAKKDSTGICFIGERPFREFLNRYIPSELIVVQGREHDALLSNTLCSADLNWISGEAPHCEWVYNAKTRYRQKDAPCAIKSLTAARCEISFAESQWAVTPGQSVVVYESRVCLGGGIIQ